MRVKVDENLPESAVRVVKAAGHDVDTVRDEGLTGADDPAVMAAAVEARRMVFTSAKRLAGSLATARWMISANGCGMSGRRASS